MTEERERIKALEREVRELRKANEIQRLASGICCSGAARPPHQILRALVDPHHDRLGIEPICRILQIAPFGYRKPELRSCRAQRDELLIPESSAYGMPTCRAMAQSSLESRYSASTLKWPAARWNA